MQLKKSEHLPVPASVRVGQNGPGLRIEDDEIIQISDLVVTGVSGKRITNLLSVIQGCQIIVMIVEKSVKL